MLKMQWLVPIGNVVSEVMIKMLSVTYYDEDDRLTFGQLNWKGTYYLWIYHHIETVHIHFMILKSWLKIRYKTYFKHLIILYRSVCHHDTIIELIKWAFPLSCSDIIGQFDKTATLLMESQHFIGWRSIGIRHRYHINTSC